jgi:hypothetical protein
MSRKYLLLAISAVFSFSLAAQAATRDIIPAGTLLHCTMDEPNFSPKTAEVGDPVLCNLGPLGSFGHSVFPRGAQLGGHFQDYKAPGHFFGKGWMSIEFDHMVLPGAQILPLSAKVISAPHNRVDAHGDIKGKGHPKRDALLWAVPIFWPIKIMTLPARGPYPTLKGESRLTLRLMDDVEVPFATARNYGVPMPDYRPSAYRGSSQTMYQQTANLQLPGPVVQRVAYSQPVRTAATDGRRNDHPITDRPLTVIALQAGTALLASRYWVQGSDLHCVSEGGAEQTVSLALVDLPQTVKVNQERNVDFVLHSARITSAVEQ